MVFLPMVFLFLTVAANDKADNHQLDINRKYAEIDAIDRDIKFHYENARKSQILHLEVTFLTEILKK
jgi:hypothetical protein